ncbi:MAG: DUF4268 domain-containing protein [Flavobacteriia bacterium]|nr:DUF4268 domain-containing protein [Flavobacteriia bacterium]OIP46893.1 MAG: hypothetical protein AUK46_07025 [Flavobacteriaceae bacterium CG2_30_31_66]PIV97043.1 MAG: DUF4268 domain-containing protein [Flavobacteriaceae bacterium CG17_big_fil_post_rev_8_21_14_2_50_31_13]PIX13402.1 MAG: DUF4268 domain-containing protein [Flavobacteriaceae bacterium CG_4_8_14_3_um_filter_31_8]PIY16329.1 MAG: DUF4268 domain-containing protein [Flavobacteriaceae bacterium CG_4_10_14_3_um_filter_31_253]PIZ12204.
MFSKEEAALLRREFWTSFGKSFPRKWLLYNTKIKGVALKFIADKKEAMICLDLENPDEIKNLLYFDQMLSLKTLLETELPEIIFEDAYELENGKIIQRIYLSYQGNFNIYNKNTWRECYEFFEKNMPIFELFFYEYEDVIKNI